MELALTLPTEATRTTTRLIHASVPIPREVIPTTVGALVSVQQKAALCLPHFVLLDRVHQGSGEGINPLPELCYSYRTLIRSGHSRRIITGENGDCMCWSAAPEKLLLFRWTRMSASSIV